MRVPRVTIVDVVLPHGEELNITPLSDLHADGEAFDNVGFSKMMKERSALPNSRAFFLGDTMDLVVPVDLRRWRASVQDKSLLGREDWLNAGVDLVSERLLEHDIKYDMIGPGNHEDEFKKRHGVDVVSMLARELRCNVGGYSGYISYKISCEQANGSVVHAGKLNILYHHGAWGGKVLKGFGGARDFARGFDGWNIFCFGHNHHATVQREARHRMGGKGNGKLAEYPAYFVCCGSWSNTYTEDAGITTYAERAGYIPVARVTPLIKVKVGRTGRKNTRRWLLDYRVEL